MYTNKNDKELRVLLTNHRDLTLQAQLNLKEELTQRDIAYNINDLENTINSKMSEIKNLEFIDNLGFKVEFTDDFIRVKRTSKAVLIDVLAAVCGVLFSIIGLMGILGIISMFFGDGDYSVLFLIRSIIMAALGGFGVRCFNGVKRFIDFLGFELVNYQGNVILKKRFDTKLIEIEKNESSIHLDNESDLLILKLEDYDILNASANNLIQSLTISELTKKLKSFGR